MLNVDTKILSNKLKTVLLTLISSQQTASVKDRIIRESSRLIFDIIKIRDWFNIERLIVTMDIQKAFDSLLHDFVCSLLRKFDLAKIFSRWMEIVLKN